MAEDRTGDFQRLCQQVARASGAAPAALEHKHSPQSAIQENAQFNAAASDISKEVYQASKRLQQLTQRALIRVVGSTHGVGREELTVVTRMCSGATEQHV